MSAMPIAHVSPIKHYVLRTLQYPVHAPPTITTTEWVRQVTPRNPLHTFLAYLRSLFPILGWIGRYNLGWLTGDLVAGITVGIVLVPQSMSYAQVTTLPPQYGLYSAFVGVFIYCFFATSKDVSIGPSAVMSLTVSQIIKHVEAKHPNEWAPQTIATAISFICGFIVLAIGLLRIGWLVEFIPAPAVSGFMTGSAINIVAGQVPGLLGITGFDTRAATYKVIINTLKGLPLTKLDAAFGLPGLVALYAFRILFDRLSRRYPHRARWFFFASITRNAVVIIVLTIASWQSMRHHRSKKGTYPIKIIQTVPRGFKNVGPPYITKSLVEAIAGELPLATIILLLEHIAISKSFGRVNGYKINPNQELIAIGVANTVGSVFNAYPATGSFSRSALKSKCGVRTPIAGIFTGVVVIVALYGLTPAFYWIPNAGLSAIIIHAVADLVAKPAHVFGLWSIAPLEFVIWIATVLVTVFTTIEDGIYTAIVSSFALLLIRVAHPRGRFLGKVTVSDGSPQQSREVYLPLNKSQPKVGEIIVRPPEPGVIVYRYEESILYPNCSWLNSALVEHAKAHTRRGKDMSSISLRDRPWNDPGPRRGHELEELERDASKPLLRAVVLDFSSVSHIDTTGVQALVDARTEMERWADTTIEFHFATVLSPWIKRALVAGGFGVGRTATRIPVVVAPVVPFDDMPDEVKARPSDDPEATARDLPLKSNNSSIASSPSGSQEGEMRELTSPEMPFFHPDLATAVRAAELGLIGRSSNSLEDRIELKK